MPPDKRPFCRRRERAVEVRAACLATFIVVVIFAAGCIEPANRTPIIEVGTPDPALLEDMGYVPSDLPLYSTQAPEGIVISNSTSGRLKDGNMLFRGEVTNERNVPITGYIIVYIEILDEKGDLYRTSHPLVSVRDLGAGRTYQYFYLTNEPVNESVSSYRILVQVSSRYPGV